MTKEISGLEYYHKSKRNEIETHRKNIDALNGMVINVEELINKKGNSQNELKRVKRIVLRYIDIVKKLSLIYKQAIHCKANFGLIEAYQKHAHKVQESLKASLDSVEFNIESLTNSPSYKPPICLADIAYIQEWYKAFGEEATGDEYLLWLSRFYNEPEKLKAIKYEDRFKTRIHAMLRLVQLWPNINFDSTDIDYSKIKTPRRAFNFDKYVELRWGIKSYKQFVADNDDSINTTMVKLTKKS
jgi:hypothetical protein